MHHERPVYPVLMHVHRHFAKSFRKASRYGVRFFQTDLRMNPFFDLCSYSCRRAYGSSEPNSHVAGCKRRGLAIILARKSPLSIGANPPDSFAIFLVYVSVFL